MKKLLLTATILMLAVGLSEGLLLARVRLDLVHVGAFLSSLALILLAFVGLTYPAMVRILRQQAGKSPGTALGIPFLLLIPYLLFAFLTGTFSLTALAKLTVYVGLPTLLLLPDRGHRAERVGWRDFAAMLALGLPVGAGWLGGIWLWPAGAVFSQPQEIYFFRPLFCVCAGAYAFLVIRGLEGVGYRLGFRKGDVADGLANFAVFALLGIPLGYALHFIQFRPHAVAPTGIAFQLFAIYFTIAIPEEFLFRGVLQNFLTKSLHGPRHGLYALLIASAIFGASHLHHAPVPNWKYAILATLAGMFYGNAYRTRQRLSSSALTHALVDTVWHFWF